MAYNKTNWVNENEPAINADNLNKIETGIEDNSLQLESYGRTINEIINNKVETNAIKNEASTETDEIYSSDYLNDKLVSVGTEAPTGGERVWFGKSKNILPQNKYIATTTINGITYTNNGDGTFNLNGTATANTTIQIIPEYIINMEAGKNYYLYCSEPYNSNTFNFSIVITVGSSTRYLLANNTLTLSQTPTNEKLQFYIANGLSVAKNNIKVMLVEGNTAPSDYEPYIKQSIKVDNEDFISTSDLISVGTNQPSDGKRVWFKKGNNLLPTNKYISTTTINGVTFTNNGDGTFNISGTATANKTIEIIPANNFQLEQGQAYYLYSSVPYNTNTFNLSIAMTDNGSLKFMTANSTYTPIAQPTQERLGIYIPNGTTVNATNVKLMLVKGNTAPSVYEPYVEPSINVDEEEWYNPNNIEKYSTKEIKIGTWIDGKPLYRKVVDIGTLPNATTKHVAHNISNIGSVVTLRGIVTDYRFFPVPFAATSGAYTISIFADTTNIEVMAGNDRSNMTGFVIIEYTKTTD